MPRRERAPPQYPPPSPVGSDSTYTKREAESAHFTVNHDIEVFKSFDDMKLKPPVLRGIYSVGYDKPSGIQQRCIVPVVRGRDVVAQAQSGTGKTAMIAIIALQLASASVNSVQIIIISPTRELATQTHDNIVKMGEFTSVKSHVCIGGKKVGEDVRKLSHGSVHVVSGTPGRMYDMIQRQVLDMKKIRVVFIDEADEMLSMGFKDQVYDIYRYAPSTVQVVLVSATLPADVIEMTEKFMVKPISVLVKNDGLTLKGLTQFHIDVEKDGWKFETLTDLYERLTITQAVVFCNTRSRVEWLAKKMVEQDFHVACMHGDMRQKDRDDVMDKFRKGEQRVLIATDVWGRGIDVQQVSLVINYDIPQKIEDYLHRVGRSARFGRKGLAITFVTSTEMGKITSIERHYNSRIREAPEDMDKYM